MHAGMPGSGHGDAGLRTRGDIDGLTAWQDVFGEGFQAMLVFAYWLLGPEERFPTTHIHTHRDRHYAFMSISLDAYRTHCRRRSDKWDTVALPTATFRSLAKPIQQT